jgi:hypothetical protein
MKRLYYKLFQLTVISALFVFAAASEEALQAGDFPKPLMYYTDTGFGGHLPKDPDVVTNSKGSTICTIPTHRGDKALLSHRRQRRLTHWQKAADILLSSLRTKRSRRPAAIVLENKVHLFYQTYGNGRHDAICHAVSEDGLRFERKRDESDFFADKATGIAQGKAILDAMWSRG